MKISNKKSNKFTTSNIIIIIIALFILFGSYILFKRDLINTKEDIENVNKNTLKNIEKNNSDNNSSKCSLASNCSSCVNNKSICYIGKEKISCQCK